MWRASKGVVMKLNVNCLSCNLKQAITITNRLGIDSKLQEAVVKEVLKSLSMADFEKCNPEIMRNTWSIITGMLNVHDPYHEIKRQNNIDLLNIMDDIEKIINTSENKLLTSLKISIIGNMIDFAAKENVSCEEVLSLINNVHNIDFVVDDSNEFFEVLSSAGTCLYIGDNCGECVLDRVFISQIKRVFPQIKVYYVVRGFPVLNDVTMEDAHMIGMDSYASIIHSGDSAPGILLSTASQDLKDKFEKCDVILSKGQGNYESLSSLEREHMFFLFMAKCEVIQSIFHTDKYGLFCVKNTIG